MKILLYITVLLFHMLITAQKTVIKEIDFNNQSIEMQFEDIDLLEIIHTDKRKISISMQDYAENPSRIEITNNEKVITIKGSRIMPFQEDLKTEKFCYEQPLFPSYKLMLPKGCDIAITFINGNFSTRNFTGNMNIRLNTGDLMIDNFEGSTNIELFSGNITAAIKDTEANILSNHGKITTTFPTTNWKKTDISLIGTIGIKKNLLSVQSINANIMLTPIMR